MYTIEGIIDIVMPGGCGGWATKAHRDLAVEVCLNNPNVITMKKLKNASKVINDLDEESLVSEKEDLRKKGIIS